MLISETQKESGNQLCLECGICCNGNAFDHVFVRDEEAAELRYLLKIKNIHQQKGFHQPCSCFENNSCSIYASRPTACQQYNCLLLKGLNEGEVSFKEATDIIRKTLVVSRSLMAKLEKSDPGNSTMSLQTRMSSYEKKQLKKMSAQEFRTLNNEILLENYKLKTLLERYFGIRKEKKKMH